MWRPLFPGPTPRRPDHARDERRAPADLHLGEPMRDLLERHLGDGWLERARDPRAWEGVLADPERRAVGRALRGAAARSSTYVRAKSQVRTACCAASSSTTCGAIEASLEPDALTIGFARRLATYKRLHLLTHDPERARRIFTGDQPGAARHRRQGAPERRAGQGRAPALLRLRARATPRSPAASSIVEDYDIGDRARTSSRAATSGSTCRAGRWRRAGRAG